MLATAIIVFREVLEAALVVGIVLAASKGVRDRLLWVGGGVGAGIAGACLVAFFAETIADAAAPSPCSAGTISGWGVTAASSPNRPRSSANR
jgi:hypothetical protein